MSEHNYWTRLQRRSVNRRTMLRGTAIAGAGLAGAALIGCGGDDDDGGGVAQVIEKDTEVTASSEEVEGETATGEFNWIFEDAPKNIPLSGGMDVSWAVGGNGWVRTQNDSVFQVADTFDGDISDFSVDTVIVMMVAQRFAGYEDSAGAPVPTFDVIGFGRVMVFSDGQVIEGEWRRAAQEDGWIFVSDAGEEILIPKGRLFVEIVPRFVDITFE